jgi:aminodeoxyfutalosine synthase
MKSSSLTATELANLEARAARGDAFARADAERLMACPDLVSIGALGEAARKAVHGDRVTFGRVCLVGATAPVELGDAGEVRLEQASSAIGDAREKVRAARSLAGGVPLTGFTLVELLQLAGGDHLALVEISRALKSDGLESTALPLDRFETESAVEVVRAAMSGGLGVWRGTVEKSTPETRLDVIERAAAVQRETKALRAFAPLARFDARDTPSTGYDDVRTIAVARLVCRSIPSIQVDWSLYGPKLAQVAIAYGADDLDAVAAVDTLQLGHRRSPAEDVRRQITSAFATPVERTGRFEPRS